MNERTRMLRRTPRCLEWHGRLIPGPVNSNEDHLFARVILAINTPATAAAGHDGSNDNPFPNPVVRNTYSHFNQRSCRIDTGDMTRPDVASKALASHRREVKMVDSHGSDLDQDLLRSKVRIGNFTLRENLGATDSTHGDGLHLRSPALHDRTCSFCDLFDSWLHELLHRCAEGDRNVEAC